MPKISVIIPVHNTEKYIGECLDSVISQTFEDIEIICVDDASTDNSLEILKDYSSRDKRIKVFHNEISKSALGARKRGVMKATGDYIMFLDSDDYYSPDACELLYDKITELNVDILHFTLGIINCSNSPEKKIEALSKYTKPFEGLLKNNDVFDYCFVKAEYTHSPVNKIYKAGLCKSAYAETEDIHLVFAEDLYAYFIIADKAESYYGWQSKPLYYYCYGRGITQTDSGYTLERFEKNCQHAKTIKVLKEYCSKKHPDDEKYVSVIKNYCDEWIIRSIRILYDNLDDTDIKKGEEIIYSYWGKENILFMKDKIDYMKNRKNLNSTVKYIVGLILNKGINYTIKVIRY